MDKNQCIKQNTICVGDEVTTVVLEKVKEAFEKIETQPDTAEKYGGLDKGPATYGVVKKLRDNDMELHTDRQVCLLMVLNLTWREVSG